MGLFRTGSRRERITAKPSWGEKRAAARTARAEAKLAQTEQQIHELANDARRDIRGKGRHR
jgi:hypothetical protein